jgi:Asp-tRNA(Asn)/Glu-tRNA(Gln) amidotransferase A subunit family amidase
MRGVRAGVPATFAERASPGVVRATEAALEMFRGLGVQAVPIEFGFPSRSAVPFRWPCWRSRPSITIETTWIPGSENTGRTCRHASGRQRRHRCRTRELREDSRLDAAPLELVDVFITPTTPFAAPLLGAHDVDGQALAMQELALFTAPFNLARVPPMSVPCGSSAERLPIGITSSGRLRGHGAPLCIRFRTGYRTAPALSARRRGRH